MFHAIAAVTVLSAITTATVIGAAQRHDDQKKNTRSLIDEMDNLYARRQATEFNLNQYRLKLSEINSRIEDLKDGNVKNFKMLVGKLTDTQQKITDLSAELERLNARIRTIREM